MTITLKPFVRRILLSSSCPIPSYDPAPNPAGVPPGRPATAPLRANRSFVTRRPAGVPLRQAGPSRCTLVPKTASRGRSSLGRPRSARRATLPDPHLLCRRTSRFTGGHLRRGSCPARGVPRVSHTVEAIVRRLFLFALRAFYHPLSHFVNTMRMDHDAINVNAMVDDKHTIRHPIELTRR